MAFPLSQDGVTIFTNGTPPDDDTTRKTLEAALTHGAKLDNRTIKSISEGPHGIGLQLRFHEGEDQHLHMLLHTPPTVNRAASLMQSLGLETQLGPDPFVVPKSPMGTTSLRGCFVAGDTSTFAKIVPIAISSGILNSLFSQLLWGKSSAKTLKVLLQVSERRWSWPTMTRRKLEGLDTYMTK